MPARRRLRGKRPAGEPVVLQDPSDGGLLDGAEGPDEKARENSCRELRLAITHRHTLLQETLCFTNPRTPTSVL